MSNTILNTNGAMPTVPGALKSVDVTEAFLDSVTTPGKLHTTTQRTLQELQNIASYVESNTNAENNNIDPNRPQLTPPAPSATRKTTDGNDPSLMMLLAELMDVMSEQSMESLKTRLEARKQIAIARQNGEERLLQEYETALSEMEVANSDFKNAHAEFEQAWKDIAVAEKTVNDAELAVKNAQAKVDASPQDTDAQQTLAFAKQQLTQAKADLSTKQESLKAAEQNVLNAFDRAEKALAKLDAAQLKLSEQGSVIDYAPLKKILTDSALLTKCMLELQQLIGENTESTLRTRLAIYREQQERLQKEAEIAAKKMEKTQRIVGILNKIMGWLGRIVGAVMTVAGFIGSVVTGGTSLVISSIGMGLLVADTGFAMAGQTTLTEMTMKPIMEKLIMPFLAKLAGVFDKILEKFGVTDKQARAIASNVLAAFAMIGMVVAAVFTLKSKSVSGFFQKVADKIMGALTWVAEKAPEILKTLASQAGTTLSKLGSKYDEIVSELLSKMGISREQIPLYLNRINTISKGTELVGTTAEAGMSVTSGYLQKDALDSMAIITEDRAGLEIIKKQMALIMEQFSSGIKIQVDLVKQISNVIEADQRTGSMVLRNSRA